MNEQEQQQRTRERAAVIRQRLAEVDGALEAIERDRATAFAEWEQTEVALRKERVSLVAERKRLIGV